MTIDKDTLAAIDAAADAAVARHFERQAALEAEALAALHRRYAAEAEAKRKADEEAAQAEAERAVPLDISTGKAPRVLDWSTGRRTIRDMTDAEMAERDA